MNFEFSDEQNMLRDQAVGFLQSKSPLTVARKILEGDDSYDAALWKEITDLGWTATAIPEKHGGVGLGHLELCVLAEELGRALSPVPFSSSVYLATEAVLKWGSDVQKESWLAKLGAGQAIGCAAIAEVPGQVTAKKINAAVNGGKLSGRKITVADGDVADVSVVLAKSAKGHSFYLVDLNDNSVSRSRAETIDPSRSHADIAFENAPAELLGKEGDAMAMLEHLLDRAAVLTAFEQVGGAEAALNMARDYALERYAFGRPIGGYQAIKHKLAKMYVALQLARSNAYYGAWALSTEAPELPVAAATARVSATQAYRECTEENIQIHGGMGFTWEFDCHLYYRRSKLLSVNLGSGTVWKDRLISRVKQQKAAA